ncbi:bifunctional YncE family protein/alkaline phosphatase family protein [Streptomyces sp. TS71-3]|uniref:bifunctional YncE family protein/alkaline phosphatase family protein n=1 Tax=Streptomyces sp. TS71-3 TaxID=2733862 RepID=UPI001B045163|nr:alkaline phosphatase family protein [Streptomyces sp. TS71-3]GHJ40883.1 phosphoesterase [Streptomyces sp. TS71-3]
MHVKRLRKPAGKSPRLHRFGGLKARTLTVGSAAVALAVTGTGIAVGSTIGFGSDQVGQTTSKGQVVSDNQIVKPIGDRLLTQFGKFMGSTVSPDGRFLAATTADHPAVLQIFDLSTYKLIWTVGSASGLNQSLSDATVGQEGPTYSPDGKFLWLPQQDGLTRFPVNSDGTLGTPTRISIPTVNSHPSGNDHHSVPNSALVAQTKYSPDGSTLYAAINGQNTVMALDPDTGAVKHTWNVGIAPRQLAFAGGKLYVSNEGGRQARAGDTTMDSYGTKVPADGYLGTSTTGSVSVIDTTKPSAAVGSIAVGLHPTAMYASHDALFVANTNSDTVSVIDTTKDQVVQTIDTKPWPSSKVGYEPDSIALTKDGHLLVSLGRANAVAVYRYDGTPKNPVSYIGLLPTDYYPATVATVGSKIVVTNTRGIDARGPAITTDKGQGTVPVSGHDTHSTTASLTRFTLPSDRDIARYTDTVFEQNGWGRNDVQQAKGNKGGKGDKGGKAAVPVPTRIGDPSTIKHVFLIVKENRTYDQLFGDMGEGNGDPSLTQFGERATPNQHALAKQFGLYDNVYDVGTNSAEGHNWLMEGDNPEYSESSAGEYQRSYDTEEDVLGHPRSGFLWTAAESAGATARNYGEFEYMEGKPAGSWQQYYCAAKSVDDGGDPAQLTAPDLKGDYGSVIPSLNKIADPQSPPFDLAIPDTYRYQTWKQDFEKKGPSNLNMVWLSSDHTGGPADSVAGVADNDLATGEIVDTISHSKYWKDSAIFVLEDDSQDGADHVDGHRAPVQVISPWAQHGKVINTYYSQISAVRTIEQILGAQPLNQKVAAATPMYDAFTSRPDYKPFTAVPNQVPLTEGIATAPACGLDTLGRTGAAAKALNKAEAQKTAVPANEQATAAAWQTWLAKQHTTGKGAVADYANPEQMNRYTWYQAHQWKSPYPGDTKIYAPSQVPGAYLPSSDTD